MDYFALQIQTGREDLICQKMQECLVDLQLQVFNPMRELIIRKGGKEKKQLKPFFPGYIFLEADSIEAIHLSLLKKIPGFYKVLPSNRNIQPVNRQEIYHLKSLFGIKQVASLSLAQFTENNRIEILQGPLKGKEGLIVNVNTRKKRAKIIISAFGQEHAVDLGFELLNHR